MEALSSLLHLSELQLSGFTPEGLDQLPNALPHLKALTYEDTHPPLPASLGAKALLIKPPQGFKALAQMRGLCHLDTGESHQPSALAGLRQQLTSLTLRVQGRGGSGAGSWHPGYALTAGGGGGGGRGRGARAGGCNGEQYERAVFAALLQLRGLQELWIEGVQLSKSHCEQMGRSLTGLRSLDVQGCEMAAGCFGVLQCLAGMKALERLRLPNGKLGQTEVQRNMLEALYGSSGETDAIQV